MMRRWRRAACGALAGGGLLTLLYCGWFPPGPAPAPAPRPAGDAHASVPMSIVSNKTSHKLKRIVISLVACGQRFNESFNVVKSALIFTMTPLYFIIFTEQDLLPIFNERLNKFKLLRKASFDYELHRVWFPEKHSKEWMNLFGKCAAQRLFIPSLIPHIDSVIYVDSDTLFLGPADDLWMLFDKFNTKQIAALALENENPNISWYTRFAKHPFYGKVGLNSGVMLMNLTRMREFRWDVYITPIMIKWKSVIIWGDQDIINVIFHYHPQGLLEMSCRYNYRSDHCMYGEGCRDATERGALVLHGSRKVFRSEKQPAFAAIYRAIDEHELGKDTKQNLLMNLQKNFNETVDSNCGNIRDAFLKLPSDTLRGLA